MANDAGPSGGEPSSGEARSTGRPRTALRWLALLVAGTVATALVLAVLGVGFALVALSNGGDSVDNGLSVTNRTSEDLTIVYLVGQRDGPRGSVIVRDGTTELGIARRNGTTLTAIPVPTENGCTVAPVVARRADGSPVSRLEPGACVLDALVEWEIG